MTMPAPAPAIPSKTIENIGVPGVLAVEWRRREYVQKKLKKI
jgi:hypothetical protein